ncbi:MAG: flagellar basal body protein [Parvularculaceae bacterium]
MDVRSTPLLSALTERLKFLSARTGVIAENIANADTPGFVARDLKAPAARAASMPLRMADPRHIANAGAQGLSRVESAPDPDASINGNEVSIETQMMKLSQTRMDYQLASTIYRKSVELVRLAARGGR